MKLEAWVAPLELSREMKALGFPQETEFSWFERDRPREGFALAHSVETQFDWEKRCAAPTVFEMGEWLGAYKMLRTGDQWTASGAGRNGPICEGKSQGEALARLLIALAKAGAIAPADLAR